MNDCWLSQMQLCHAPSETHCKRCEWMTRSPGGMAQVQGMEITPLGNRDLSELKLTLAVQREERPLEGEKGQRLYQYTSSVVD